MIYSTFISIVLVFLFVFFFTSNDEVSYQQEVKSQTGGSADVSQSKNRNKDFRHCSAVLQKDKQTSLLFPIVTKTEGKDQGRTSTPTFLFYWNMETECLVSSRQFLTTFSFLLAATFRYLHINTVCVFVAVAQQSHFLCLRVLTCHLFSPLQSLRSSRWSRSNFKHSLYFQQSGEFFCCFFLLNWRHLERRFSLLGGDSRSTSSDNFL